jgi:hypothetical protein
VSVEIEKAEAEGHQHSMREIQELSIDIENNKDTVRVTVMNADGGKYVLNFQDQKTLQYRASKEISTNATANDMNSAVTSYCLAAFDSWCDVELTMFDGSDSETTDVNTVVKRVYLIKIRKLIKTASTSNIIVAKKSTSATILVETPQNV